MNDLPPTTNADIHNADVQLSREIGFIVCGVVLFLLVGVLLLAFSQGWGFWQLPVFLGLALFIGGSLIGFLFAIPKVAANPPSSNADKPSDETQSRLLDVNTNLEQISDWLTKIIVGLGLVELRSIPKYVAQFVGVISPIFSSWQKGAPLAVTLYFPVLGFTSGYLMTRLYLSGLIGRADKQLRNQRRVDNKVELLRQTPEHKDAIVALQQSLVNKASPGVTVSPKLTKDETGALRATDQWLKQKSESRYTWKDWTDRAFAALAEQKQTQAIDYFAAAARVKSATSEEVAKALVNQAIVEDTLGRSPEAIAGYNEVISRFGGAHDGALKSLVATAMYSKGTSLLRSRRWEECIITFDEFIRRFGGDSDPQIRDQVVSAINNRGLAFFKTGRPDEASQAFDELINRLKGSNDAKSEARLVTALANKAEMLGRAGKRIDAVKLCDETLDRFRETMNVEARDRLVLVAFVRGVTLHSDDKSKANAALEALVAQSSSNTNPTVRELVAKAREYLAEPDAEWQYIDVNFE